MICVVNGSGLESVRGRDVDVVERFVMWMSCEVGMGLWECGECVSWGEGRGVWCDCCGCGGRVRMRYYGWMGGGSGVLVVEGVLGCDELGIGCGVVMFGWFCVFVCMW